MKKLLTYIKQSWCSHDYDTNYVIDSYFDAKKDGIITTHEIERTCAVCGYSHITFNAFLDKRKPENLPAPATLPKNMRYKRP